MADDEQDDHVPFVLCSLYVFTSLECIRVAHRDIRLERNLGFIVACMPILRPLFATMLKISSDGNLRSVNWYRKSPEGSTTGMLEQDAKAYENIDGDYRPPLPPKAVTSISINPR